MAIFIPFTSKGKQAKSSRYGIRTETIMPKCQPYKPVFVRISQLSSPVAAEIQAAGCESFGAHRVILTRVFIVSLCRVLIIVGDMESILVVDQFEQRYIRSL